MNKLPLRLTALVACLFSGLAAHAVPLTYDFAGTGSVCTFASDASCASTYEGAFSGSVTIDVLANGPSGPDSFTNGSTLAYDYDGWLQSDFLIQWDGNSFNPGPVDSQIASDNYVQLVNGYIGAEHLFNREAYRGFDGALPNHVTAREDGSYRVVGLPGPGLVAVSAMDGYVRVPEGDDEESSPPQPSAVAITANEMSDAACRRTTLGMRGHYRSFRPIRRMSNESRLQAAGLARC